MKRLVIIHGPMGVGKSAVCRELLARTERSVYLDGDWCWNMHPFVVNEENKAMVLQNIRFLLRSFLQNSGLQTVIFCWVMQDMSILQSVLKGVSQLAEEVYVFTLTAEPSNLRARLEKDIRAGLRDAGSLDRALAYLPLYANMPTVHLSTDDRSPAAAAEEIAGRIGLE